MIKKSITVRWLRSTMLIILIFLILILVFGVRSIRTYYYKGVEQVIKSRADAFVSIIEKETSVSPEIFARGILNEIERFADRDIIEITAVDRNGKAIMNSTGFEFSPESENIYEFNLLENVRDVWFIGETETGENYMSYTVKVNYTANTPETSQIYALKFATSIDKIHQQIIIIIIFFVIVAFIVMLAVINSGAYFINSIVIPLKLVNDTTRKIASGDFSQRMVVKTEDEVGELIKSINYMAEELEESEQIKNDFISSVSHELRTPLTAIKGWTETLIEIDDKVMIDKGLKIVLTETNRLEDMLEELLDFSRIQSGKFSLILDEIDLKIVLRETVDIFAERATRKNINFVYNEDEKTSNALGDKNRLKQVFVNILDNAMKYTPEEGTVTVNITEADGYIVITFEDTGSGISKKDLENVKTKFFKGANSRQGSGIGLSVVDEIISLHNGEFNIESEKFEGTTVTIKIPNVESEKNEVNLEVNNKNE